MIIDDWLRRAQEGDDADHALDEAEALCRDAWRSDRLLAWLVAHRPADLERLGRVVARTKRLGLEEAAVWPLRNAAEAMVLLLDDDPGARALYDEAADRFAREDAAPVSFGVLVEGAHALWSDDRRTRALLDRALQCAFAPSDHAVLASAAARVGDSARAVAILEDVPTAGLDAQARWSVANAWLEVEGRDRARALLDEGLAQGTDVASLCTLLRAFASHGDEDGVARALAAVDRRAATASDWVAVADAAHDAELDEPVVRERLERGLLAAGGEKDRIEVAAAHVSLLADPEAADAIAPRGFRPEDLRRFQRALPSWPDDAAALFDHLRAKVPDATLERIAAADYGTDFDKHLAALRDLVTTGRVPQRLPWEPHEVLGLVRWSEGEEVDHLERAFVCITLLLGDPDEGANTVAPLVESVLTLGDPAHRHAEAWAAWQYRTAPADDTEALVTALWGLGLLAVARDPDDARVGGLADALAALASGEEWLRVGHLAEEVLEYAVRAEMWQALTVRWLVPHRDRAGVAALLEVLGVG